MNIIIASSTEIFLTLLTGGKRNKKTCFFISLSRLKSGRMNKLTFLSKRAFISRRWKWLLSRHTNPSPELTKKVKKS